MDPSAHLDTVIELLGRMNTEVRCEHLGGDGGGLCVVRGRRMLFIDLDSDPATRLERSLVALATCPELDEIYVPPVIRDLIDRAGA